MAGKQVEILGEKEVAKRLEGIGEAVEFSGKAGKAAAVLVARSAAGIGPNRSGNLAGSYRGLGSKKQGRVTSRLVYSPIIEFGWPRRGIVAQSRVQRAIDQNAGAIAAIYERFVRDTIAAKGAAP